MDKKNVQNRKMNFQFGTVKCRSLENSYGNKILINNYITNMIYNNATEKLICSINQKKMMQQCPKDPTQCMNELKK